MIDESGLDWTNIRTAPEPSQEAAELVEGPNAYGREAGRQQKWRELRQVGQANAWLVLSKTLLAQQCIFRASRVFHIARRLDPVNWGISAALKMALNVLSAQIEATGNPVQAVKIYQQPFTVISDQATKWSNLGNTLCHIAERPADNPLTLLIKVLLVTMVLVWSNKVSAAEQQQDRPKFPLKCLSDEAHLYEALGKTVLKLPPSELIASFSVPHAFGSPLLNANDKSQEIGCYGNPFQITGIEHAELYLVTEEQRWLDNRIVDDKIKIRQVSIAEGTNSLYTQKAISKAICNKDKASIIESAETVSCLYPGSTDQSPPAAIASRVSKRDIAGDKEYLFSCPPNTQLGSTFPCSMAFLVRIDLCVSVTFYPPASGDINQLINQVSQLKTELDEKISSEIITDYDWTSKKEN